MLAVSGRRRALGHKRGVQVNRASQSESSKMTPM